MTTNPALKPLAPPPAAEAIELLQEFLDTVAMADPDYLDRVKACVARGRAEANAYAKLLEAGKNVLDLVGVEERRQLEEVITTIEHGELAAAVDQAPPTDPLRVRLRVKWFNSSKGYGFLEGPAHPREVFIHYTCIGQEWPGAWQDLSEGDEVECEVIDGPKGPQAANLKILKKAEAAS